MGAADQLVGWALAVGLLALALGTWCLMPGRGTVRRGFAFRGSLVAMATYWLLMAALLAALTCEGGVTPVDR